MRVKGFDERGRFVLGNGLVLKTPILCYGGKVFVWEAAAGLGETGAFNLEGIEPADLSVLRAVKPKPDILVVGSGERRRGPPAAGTKAKLSESVRELLYGLNVSVELVDTKTAISTFNILQQDGRRVMAALLPVAAPNQPRG